jgi:hypothetical protein
MSITGFFNYNGLTTMQHIDVKEKFLNLLVELKPSKILEIGTASGGLTLLIRNLLDEIGLEKTSIETYDVNHPNYLQNFVDGGSNIKINVKNVFNHNYNELLDGKEVVDYITSEGVTLVLCDGGSKINEFNLLSDYLKVGDVIMAHDYSPNREYFEENLLDKVWNWMEIQDSDIDECCKRNNLIPYMAEEFKQVVWVCKIKKK